MHADFVLIVLMNVCVIRGTCLHKHLFRTQWCECEQQQVSWEAADSHKLKLPIFQIPPIRIKKHPELVTSWSRAVLRPLWYAGVTVYVEPGQPVPAWKTGMKSAETDRSVTRAELHQFDIIFNLLEFRWFPQLWEAPVCRIFYLWPEWQTIFTISAIHFIILLEWLFSESAALEGPVNYLSHTELLCSSEDIWVFPSSTSPLDAPIVI